MPRSTPPTPRSAAPRLPVVAGLFAAAAMLAIAVAPPAAAQDAAAVNAKFIHVKMENDRVRVLETILPPGAKEEVHSHPACVIYVVEGGTTRSHTPDGKVADLTLRTGDVLYREPLTHWAENTGTTALHLVLVELKKPA